MSAAAGKGADGEGRGAATGLVLLGVASVQCGSAAATTLFDELGPGGAVFVRTIVAAAILLAIWRPRRRAIAAARRDVVLFGLVLAGMNFSFYLALDRLPLGIAVTFEFAGPLAVAILASRSRLDFVWAGLAATAVILLAPQIGDGLDALGVAFALSAATFWAFYILLSARVGRGPAGNGGLAVAMAVGTVALLPFGIAGGGADLFDPALLAVGAAVGVLSSAIPYTAEIEALKRLPEGTFGVLLSLEPAFAALVGLIALDQGLAPQEVIAIGLVVVASAGAVSTAPGLEPAPEA